MYLGCHRLFQVRLVPPYDVQHENKYEQPTQHDTNILGNQGIRKHARYLMQFGNQANKHECRQQRVDDWMIGNQDKKSVRVCSQPDVILGDVKLERDEKRPKSILFGLPLKYGME